MSDPDLASRHIGVLRNAARGGQERFLVALPDPVERQRIASALANEGFVLEVESTADALARLADESFDLAFLTLDDEGGNDPLAASRELRPFTDIVLITESDPVRCAAAFRREVASVLPRPLPEVDALLRAHVKRLAGFRRSRTRGLLVMNAFAGIRARDAGRRDRAGGGDRLDGGRRQERADDLRDRRRRAGARRRVGAGRVAARPTRWWSRCRPTTRWTPGSPRRARARRARR